MSVASLTDAVWEALSHVQDPEIHKPITELGMVESVEVDEYGQAAVAVLLTISGCPMQNTIEHDVHAALRMKVNDMPTRDFLRAELRDLLEELTRDDEPPAEQPRP